MRPRDVDAFSTSPLHQIPERNCDILYAMKAIAAALAVLVGTFCPLVAQPQITSLQSRPFFAQTISGTVPGIPFVTGARSYSPIVENLDATMAIYAKLGLKVPPPEKGSSYPWDEE